MRETIFACTNMQIISLLCIQNTHRKIKGFLLWIFICSDLALLHFFFLPRNNIPEVLRNKLNLTDLQLMYFQSSKSVQTNMDVDLIWMVTSKWFFKSKSVSCAHVLLKNTQLPGSENIPCVYQKEKTFLKSTQIWEVQPRFFCFPCKFTCAKYLTKSNPTPKPHKHSSVFSGGLTSAIGNSDQNWVNILRIFMSLWLLWVSFSLAYS